VVRRDVTYFQECVIEMELPAAVLSEISTIKLSKIGLSC
jgi:hypothetical protein